MYPIDASTARFEAVEILGIPGLFTVERINRTTIPQGMYLYEMQTSEEDWAMPCLLGRRIMVEHFGSVLTASPIALPESGYLDLNPGDFTQGSGADLLTAAQFEDRWLGRPAAVPAPVPAPAKQHRHIRRPHKAHAAAVR